MTAGKSPPPENSNHNRVECQVDKVHDYAGQDDEGDSVKRLRNKHVPSAGQSLPNDERQIGVTKHAQRCLVPAHCGLHHNGTKI